MELFGGLFGLAILVFMIVGQWKVNTKANKPGWAIFVPIYNNWVLFEVAGMDGWKSLLLFVPIVNIYFAIVAIINLAKAFGKGIGFALGLIFFSPIFMCILGYGSAQHVSNTTYFDPNTYNPNPPTGPETPVAPAMPETPVMSETPVAPTEAPVEQNIDNNQTL